MSESQNATRPSTPRKIGRTDYGRSGNNPPKGTMKPPAKGSLAPLPPKKP